MKKYFSSFFKKGDSHEKKPDIHWQGQSGKQYGYWIVSIYASFNDMPGNYIFAKKIKTGNWKPVYISQTSNLAFRLPYNDGKRNCALQNKATHIHVHINHDGTEARMTETTDLINKWHPVCNV